MDPTTRTHTPRGCSTARDPARAAQELYEAIHLPSAALTFFFCSPEYEPDALTRELQHRFEGARLIGCTTAGEITPLGYQAGAITGASLPAGEYTVATAFIEDLDAFAVSDAPRLCARMLGQLGQDLGAITAQNTFGFLLIDGLSRREEIVISALYNSLGHIPVFGGSAADGLSFTSTRVFAEGAFHEGAAVFALVHTVHPFTVFKTQHFVASKRKMVVTGADVTRRVVTEINGEAAAVEYAQLVGVPLNELDPAVFATHPVVVRIGGADYVRSIQKVNPDGSLTFYCAIDEGLVLALAEGLDLQENLEALFRRLRSEVGELELVIGCDCILRRLEMERAGGTAAAGRLLAENRVVGFSTYGEQYRAMHINQTFTGVAIGTGEKPHV
jgi:hypothetical protein